jgi:hypothetical protein
MRQRCYLPMSIAHAHHLLATTGPGYLVACEAGLDHPSLRRRGAFLSAESLNFSARAASSLAPHR